MNARARTLAALAALALGACSHDKTDPYAAEKARREAYARSTLEDAGAARAWAVSSTSEIQFEEGFSILSFDPPDEIKQPRFYNHAFRWMGQHARVRLKTHGERPMKVHVAGWVHENVIRSRPVIQLFVDGYYLETSSLIERHGHYQIEKVVPTWMLRRPWVDLVIRTSTVGWHWSDPPELNTVLVYRFAWTEEGT